MSIGSTGNYPDGSLGKGDEGELRFAIGRDDDGNVVVNFGKDVSWLAMPSEVAIDFAKSLLKNAGAKKVEITL